MMCQKNDLRHQCCEHTPGRNEFTIVVVNKLNPSGKLALSGANSNKPYQITSVNKVRILTGRDDDDGRRPSLPLPATG